MSALTSRVEGVDPLRGPKRGSAFGAWLLAMVAALPAGGCASFAKHRLPRVESLEADPGREPVDATYELSWESDLGQRQSLDSSVLVEVDGEFAAQLGYGGWMRPRHGQLGDVHIDAHMLNYASPGGMVAAIVVAGGSLLTLPGWVTDNYELRATVTSESGKRTEYRLDDALTSVFWLPMILLTPFKYPETIAKEVRENMYRTLVLKMHQDGWI